MKKSASPSVPGWSLSYASLCSDNTILWPGVSEDSSIPSQGVADAEGTCHLAHMVVVLAALPGDGPKDHHVARGPSPASAFSLWAYSQNHDST